MKKIMVAISAASLAAVAAYGAGGSVPVQVDTNRIARFVGYVRHYMVSTNEFCTPELWAFNTPRELMTNATVIAEVDSILAQKPPLQLLRIKMYGRMYPSAFTAALERYKNTFPNLVKKRRGEKLSLEEEAASVVETVLFADIHDVDKARTQIGDALSKLIIPTLRRQGKAITVGQDGVSPVKTFADRISSALNAPQMDGLNAILQEMNVPAAIDMRARCIPAMQEAQAMADEIMTGYVNATPHRLGLLSVALGTDAYNAFIERYNGGTR